VELAAAFPTAVELETETSYRQWFLRICGVLGDPIAAKGRIADATEKAITLGAAAYGYKQAFKNAPSEHDLRLLHSVLTHTWGRIPEVLDPTAGGGSIPFEAIRYGLPTIANDLNPIAAAILRAGVGLPATYGTSLLEDLKVWGRVLVDRVETRLRPYFKKPDASDNTSYIFVRTVACPRTGKPVPLSPNWWLSRDKGGVAVRFITERRGQPLDHVEFDIVLGKKITFKPDDGTVAGGNGVSPWDHLAIDGDYIKAEAQAGRMSSQLYAVAVRIAGKRGFRAPTRIDLEALADAERELNRRLPAWLVNGIVPVEDIDQVSNYNRGHRLYGINTWRDMFSPRQLLVHGTFVEEFCQVDAEVRAALPGDRADAVLALLAMMQGKALNWSALSSSWNVNAGSARSVFDKHNFAFTWTYAEIEGARELYSWCLEQLVDAYDGIGRLLQPSGGPMFQSIAGVTIPGPVTVMKRNAADLRDVQDRSQTLVCIDPPYYDNVMYAELSDFFLVWEQHTIGRVWPDLFDGKLSDKQNEAVANVARFEDAGSRKRELANADYEAKMAAIFAECHRVLRDDGVLTVMFTHKRAEAWDTLGMGLMEAGFVIETSWPVNTEREQSLHQSNKNAAASTIFLVCRKRAVQADTRPYFEDVEADVRASARDALARFSAAGISGVDLLLATYGPALSVISARWPVHSSEADPVTGRSRLIRPEEALSAAREEVVRMQRLRLIGRAVQLDLLTDFALIAWDTFKAAEFPFDEARRLGLAVGGLDVDELARAKVLEKKSGTVVLLPPAKRVRRRSEAESGLSGVRVDATSFPVALDAVHTVMHLASADGLAAAKALIDRAGLATEPRFLATLQGLVRAIPRTKSKGQWVRPEAAVLDALCAAYFPAIEIPQVVSEPAAQLEIPDDDRA
jgi:adenine-specific DNA methylase